MRPSCQNREQVLAWYRLGRAKGVRAEVFETVILSDKILVGISVSGGQSSSESDQTQRWQILTVKDGSVVDIRGFEERDTAISRMD